MLVKPNLLAEGRADAYHWVYENENNANTSQYEVTAEETKFISVIGSFKTCQPDTAEAILYVYPKIDYLLNENNYTLHLNDEIWIQPSYDSTRNYQYEWSPSWD